ncbi:hypothetical protein O6P43_023025 [Quillaja saponaria]|uniref:Uncharacterized protein n=1 Tax=Quillaja saponaria TaxID=32244 RepID=A0AAD7LFV0_QUISA|nr:hypothetical protein O6P43_023025 [Quillaja saponaria]
MKFKNKNVNLAEKLDFLTYASELEAYIPSSGVLSTADDDELGEANISQRRKKKLKAKKGGAMDDHICELPEVTKQRMTQSRLSSSLNQNSGAKRLIPSIREVQEMIRELSIFNGNDR